MSYPARAEGLVNRITDEPCPGLPWSQERTYPHLWCWSVRRGNSSIAYHTKWQWETSCLFFPDSFDSRKHDSQLDKEGFGIIFRVKIPPIPAWTDFPDRTDHKPLVSLFRLTKPVLDSLPPRIIKWSLLISSYDYSIMFKPRTNIVAADAMSHLPLLKTYKSRCRDASFT